MGATATTPRRRNIAKIKTGTYTGNAADNRDIDIGVNLAAKNNAYVIVKGNTLGSSCPSHRIEYAQGDLAMCYEAIADVADRIQGFTATGFQVGSSNEVNGDTIVYRYIAIWEEP